jgi:hypothetical protein
VGPQGVIRPPLPVRRDQLRVERGSVTELRSPDEV